jgi:pimeloyl-ACP methyl ester carboxylesterase
MLFRVQSGLIVSLVCASIMSMPHSANAQDARMLNGKPLPDFYQRLPKENENNVWYKYTDSDTVFVFIHGILSNSQSCWLYRDTVKTSKGGDAYWPEIVATDRRLGGAAIYLAGYYTAIDQGAYDIRQAASEVLGGLTRLDVNGHRVIDKHNIVFIAHSTGGLVARYLLVHNSLLFTQKTVGLYMVASPSLGSQWANTAGVLIDWYNNTMANQLKMGDPFLDQLDVDFKTLLNDHTLAIAGAEKCENHFILRVGTWPFLFNKQYVVDPQSCAAYFGPSRIMPNTDHFSIAKPANSTANVHQELVDFMQKQLGPLATTNATKQRRAFVVSADVTPTVTVGITKDEQPAPFHYQTDNCKIDTTITRRYPVTSGWHLLRPGIVTTTVAVGQGTSVSGVSSEGDTAVIVTVRVRGSGVDTTGKCVTTPEMGYQLTLLEERLESKPLPPKHMTGLLTPDYPTLVVEYQLSPDVTPRTPVTWAYTVYIDGYIGTDRYVIDLTSSNPNDKTSGMTSMISSDGKLLVDVSNTFLKATH